jgi:acyl carrier protein
MTQIREWIKKYVADCVQSAGLTSMPRDDDDLLQVFDSLQVLRLMLELEKEFFISVDNSDFSPQNIGSIERLAAYVARKQRGPAGRPLVTETETVDGDEQRRI